jgi:hypothetical protein
METTTTTTTVNLKQEALKNGLIWGAINVIIFLATWYIAPSLMSSYAYAGVTFLIGIGLAVFFCLDMRKKAGGFWTFGEALWNIFVMFLLSMAIMYVFNVVFGKYIDQTYPQTMKELVMTKTESTLESLGMTEDQIAEAMASSQEDLDKQFTPTFSQAVTGFGIASIFYFIGAMIFAAIFKKNKPVFLGGTED